MIIKKLLSDYALKADKFLDSYLDEKKKLAGKIDPILVKALNSFEKTLYGGKKARGALTVLGYKIAGGKENKAILQVSCAIEVLHNFLLIHDDIIDKDIKRRGRETLHVYYSKKRGSEYGQSIAMVIGDMGSFLGFELVTNSNFPKEKINKALSKLNYYLLLTVYGEILDIDFDFKTKVSWEDIYKARLYKSAYYTLVMPLTVGAVLGRVSKRSLAAIEKYGSKVGIAFQLRDDVLGIFGDPKVTGKSNESDIREGKKTLLYAKALESASKKQREFLLENYGKKGIRQKEIARIRKIFEKSDSLSHSEELARKLANQGKAYIPEITKNKKLQLILSNLADFLVTRDK